MKKNVFSLVSFLCCLFLLSPLIASAHPGRTDTKGGHYCRTNCGKWGLSPGEYHHHGGGSSGGGNSNSGSSNSGSRSTQKKSTPKQQIDEKQAEANQYYKKAKSLYDSGDYKAAIDELEKIYELNKNDSTMDSLMKKCLSAIYRLAKTANKDKDYETAIEHLNVLIQNEHTSAKLKQQDEDLLKEVEGDGKIENLLTEAISAENSKNYDKSLGYIQEAKKLKDLKKITALYDEIMAALTKDAELAYRQKNIKLAISYYQLLVKFAANPKLKTEYETTLQKIEGEKWLVGT